MGPDPHRGLPGPTREPSQLRPTAARGGAPSPPCFTGEMSARRILGVFSALAAWLAVMATPALAAAGGGTSHFRTPGGGGGFHGGGHGIGRVFILVWLLRHPVGWAILLLLLLVFAMRSRGRLR